MPHCPHQLTPAYDPARVPEPRRQDARLHVLLKRLSRYRRCTLCGKIGKLSPSGAMNWCDAHYQEERERGIAEWYAQWGG